MDELRCVRQFHDYELPETLTEEQETALVKLQTVSIISRREDGEFKPYLRVEIDLADIDCRLVYHHIMRAVYAILEPGRLNDITEMKKLA